MRSSIANKNKKDLTTPVVITKFLAAMQDKKTPRFFAGEFERKATR